MLRKLRDWVARIGRRRAALLIAVNIVVPVILLALVASALKMKRFVDRDPAFCALCHKSREAYTLWTRTEHQHVVCQDCHHQSQNESLEMLVGYMFQNKAPISKTHSPKVEINSCLECHIRHDKGWPAIDASIGHKVHVKKAGLNCLKCHSRAIHSFRDPAESCLECHKSRKFIRNGMERVHCLSCHNFLNDQQSLLPDRWICIDCHQAKGIMHSAIPNNAPMAKFPCFACHHPHVDEPKAMVSCSSCHKKIQQSGFHGVKAHSNCVNCHKAHEWRTKPRDCTTCHKDKISHYAHKDCVECHSFREDKKGRKGKGP